MYEKNILISLIIFIILLTGCSKIIETEKQDIKVEIINTNYSPMWTQMVGETFITYPSKYEVTVKYKGKEYTVDNEEVYQKYKDKIGEIVDAELTTNIYDTGNVVKIITKIK